MLIARTPFNRYLPISKIGFLTMMTYRWECLFASVSCLVTVFFSYYLWQAVYESSTTIASVQSFEKTFTYVAVSIAIIVTFNTSAEGTVSRSIITGDIIREIVRPLTYHYNLIAASLGIISMRGILVFIPCISVTLFLLPDHSFDPGNILLFGFSLLFSFLILLHIDMLAGLIAVRTEAVWGIRLAKEYLVLVFSGALIPLHLLPPDMAAALMYFPFQGICHTPMTILTSGDIAISQLAQLIGMQMFWAGFLFTCVNYGLRRVITRIETNGG